MHTDYKLLKNANTYIIYCKQGLIFIITSLSVGTTKIQTTKKDKSWLSEGQPIVNKLLQ